MIQPAVPHDGTIGSSLLRTSPGIKAVVRQLAFPHFYPVNNFTHGRVLGRFAAQVLRPSCQRRLALYQCRGQGHGAELRANIRAERSRPILTELFAILDPELPA